MSDCEPAKADRSKAAFPQQDPRSPLLYENAAAECERVGHRFKRWQLPSGPLKALCCWCGLTYPMEGGYGAWNS